MILKHDEKLLTVPGWGPDSPGAASHHYSLTIRRRRWDHVCDALIWAVFPHLNMRKPTVKKDLINHRDQFIKT